MNIDNTFRNNNRNKKNQMKGNICFMLTFLTWNNTNMSN